jgi:hypothetical protein
MRSRVFLFEGFSNNSSHVISELTELRNKSITDVASGDCGLFAFSSDKNELYMLNDSHDNCVSDQSYGTSSQGARENVQDEPNSSPSNFKVNKINLGRGAKIQQISCLHHLLILMTDGTLYAKGGRIGRHLKKLPFVPIPTTAPGRFNSYYHRPTDPEIVAMPPLSFVCSGYHCSYLVAREEGKFDGDVYKLEEYGRGINRISKNFTDMRQHDHAGQVKKIAAGGDHLLILTTNGFCYGSGGSHYGNSHKL